MGWRSTQTDVGWASLRVVRVDLRSGQALTKNQQTAAATTPAPATLSNAK